MRTSLPAITLGTAVGGAAAVALYAAIAPSAPTDTASAAGTAPAPAPVPPATVAGTSAPGPRVLHRAAPCTGSSRLEDGVCVVHVRRTVTRVVPAPAPVAPPAPAPVVAAPTVAPVGATAGTREEGRESDAHESDAHEGHEGAHEDADESRGGDD